MATKTTDVPLSHADNRASRNLPFFINPPSPDSFNHWPTAFDAIHTTSDSMTPWYNYTPVELPVLATDMFPQQLGNGHNLIAQADCYDNLPILTENMSDIAPLIISSDLDWQAHNPNEMTMQDAGYASSETACQFETAQPNLGIGSFCWDGPSYCEPFDDNPRGQYLLTDSSSPSTVTESIQSSNDIINDSSHRECCSNANASALGPNVLNPCPDQTVRRYSCKMTNCLYTNKEKRRVNVHTWKRHTSFAQLHNIKNRPKMCTGCNYMTSRTDNLQRHRRIVHGEQQREKQQRRKGKKRMHG